MTHLYIHVFLFIFFFMMVYHRGTESSSLCCTAGPCCLYMHMLWYNLHLNTIRKSSCLGSACILWGFQIIDDQGQSREANISWEFLILLLLFRHTERHVGSYFPDQGKNLCPLQWKYGILTTGLPQKSLMRIFKSVCLEMTPHLGPQNLELERAATSRWRKAEGN